MSFWQVFIVFSIIAALCLVWPMLMRRKQVAGSEEGAAASVSNNAIWVTGLVLAVPLFTFIAYGKLGAKDDWQITQAIVGISANPDASKEEYQELARNISKRLDESPQNTQLWYYYAGIVSQLGNYNQAARAYGHLREAFPDSALIAAEYAQVLFFKEGRVVTDQVKELSNAALAIEPEQPTALGLAGIDAFQSKQFAQAISYWQSAVRRLAPESPAAEGLSRAIAQAQVELEKQGGSAPSVAAVASDVKADGKASNESLALNVSIAPSVLETLTGQETVFVYARAWQGAKMPLAIQRLSVSSLPGSITLDKSMAMAPGMDITAFPKLELVARVSASGNAIAQSGDWIGTFGPVSLADASKPFELLVNSKVP